MTRASEVALRAIDAAYSPIASEEQWLAGITAELDALGVGGWHAYTIAGGVGQASFRYEATSVLSELPHRAKPQLIAALHAPSPPVDRSGPRVARMSRALGIDEREIKRKLRGRPPPETAILGCDDRGNGALFAVPGDAGLTRQARRALAAMAAHVSAAYRLRARVVARTADAADAVCDPAGALLHASSAAVAVRESLGRGVAALERARIQARKLEPDDALSAWTAMVEGRWTLVDHVEHDGKRLVLAYRNDAASELGTLCQREAQVASLAALGHSDKYIAYELGIQRSTVATHLRRALAKLRLKSRRELVRVFGPCARLRAGRRAAHDERLTGTLEYGSR